MSIDWDQLALPKGKPIGVVTEQRRADRKSRDERESDKVRKRSGGRCEIKAPNRCERRGVHCHHMLSGMGVRGRGESALAIRKQMACEKCHSLITSKKLRRLGGDPPVWTDSYFRVRA